MTCHLYKTRLRGDFTTHEIKDLTRVSHPKTADIVELRAGHLVVPVDDETPIRLCDSLTEALSYIDRYLGAGE